MATASKPLVLPQWSQAKDWNAVVRLLTSLAFAVEGKDPWHHLGLATVEGPLPTLDVIHNRGKFVEVLLSEVRAESWTPEDAQKLSETRGLSSCGYDS